MQQLAAYVGLSRQTLSKYFNDPQQVSAQTQQLIQTAIEQTGFRPNLFASNLKRNKSRVIGMIIPSITDPFYMQLVSRISEMAEIAGYFTFTLPSNGKQSIEAEAVAKLKSMNVAGAFVVPLGKSSVQSKLRHMEDSLPIVYLDTPPAHQAPFIGSDNQQGITLLVDYLCQKGTPPAFLAMPEINRNANTRLQAYYTAMEKNKQSPFVLTASGTDWQFETYGHQQTALWLASDNCAAYQALLCANDRLAYGALLAAWERKLQIGREIGQFKIAGHDDHPLAAYTCPPLTTAAQHYDIIAKTAVDTLLNLIMQKPLEVIKKLIPMNLIERQSA